MYRSGLQAVPLPCISIIIIIIIKRHFQRWSRIISNPIAFCGSLSSKAIFRKVSTDEPNGLSYYPYHGQCMLYAA